MERSLVCLVGILMLSAGCAVIWWPLGLIAAGALFYIDAQMPGRRED